MLARELEPFVPGSAGSARSVALGLAVLMVGGLSMARALGKTELSDEVLRAARAVGLLALSAASSPR
jgi:hypothetical protein